MWKYFKTLPEARNWLEEAKYKDKHGNTLESGTQPKVLQKLLGHASIQTTMDRCVYVTDESLDKAIQQFEICQISVSVPKAQKCVKNA